MHHAEREKRGCCGDQGSEENSVPGCHSGLQVRHLNRLECTEAYSFAIRLGHSPHAWPAGVPFRLESVELLKFRSVNSCNVIYQPLSTRVNTRMRRDSVRHDFLSIFVRPHPARKTATPTANTRGSG